MAAAGYIPPQKKKKKKKTGPKKASINIAGFLGPTQDDGGDESLSPFSSAQKFHHSGGTVRGINLQQLPALKIPLCCLNTLPCGICVLFPWHQQFNIAGFLGPTRDDGREPSRFHRFLQRKFHHSGGTVRGINLRSYQP